MSGIPDFSTVGFEPVATTAVSGHAKPWLTPEGIAVKPAIRKATLKASISSRPGPASRPSCAAPTRPCMSTQPWTVRQYAGFSTAEDSNAFYRRNLAAGQKGLSVAFDLATHRGYDSDHPRVVGDVGMAGVAVDSIYDMETLFDGIPLDQMSRVDDHERRGAAGPGLLHRRGRGAGRAAGEADRAPFRTTFSKSSWCATPTSIRRRLRCGSSRTSSHTPRKICRSSIRISISGYHMQEAGATPDMEMAYTLADGVEYVRAGIKAGSTSTGSRRGCRSSGRSA